jgi:hypothetical protein
MSGESGRQQWNKGPRPKEAAAYRKRKDIQWDLQADFWAGDHKGNGRIFCQTSKNQGLGIVEGTAAIKTEENPTHSFSVRAGNVGAPATQDSFAPIV